MAGSALNDTQLPEPTRLEMWHHGLGFSLALLLIMLSHEMGHFLLARRHKVDATWPFFIPAPLLSVIGTLGAVLRLRSLSRIRTALLALGAAGALAARRQVSSFVGLKMPVALLSLGFFSVFPGRCLFCRLFVFRLGLLPPLSPPEERLDGPRRFLLPASLALFVLWFSPFPLGM